MRVLAKRFSVGLEFVRDIVKRYRETGEVKPSAYQREVEPKVRGVGEEVVREWLSKEPDLTLETLCARYKEAPGVGVSASAMDWGLDRLNFTRKKVSQSNRGGPPIKKVSQRRLRNS
jgi:transposase